MGWRIRFQSLLGCVLSLLMRVRYKKELFRIHSDDLSGVVPSLSSSYRVGFSCLPPRDTRPLIRAVIIFSRQA